ncbi:MAG: hypothetical protein PVJ60_04065 [Phycisphaerales bacterium]|jgi:hypothetical protein
MIGAKNKRYVAFFDILGFKEAVQNDLDEAWGALEDVRVSMEETLNTFIKTPDEIILTRNSERTAATNFSDSILIFSLKGNSNDLHSILILSTALFAKSLNRCVPLRGGISYGNFYCNYEKNLFCGVPMIRAYELAESAQWSGIIIDDNVAKHYLKNPIKSYGKSALMRYLVPVKNKRTIRKKEPWVLNWPLVCKNNFNTNPPISAKLYSKAFESLFKSSYDKWPEDIQAKYDNTVEFINSVLK